MASPEKMYQSVTCGYIYNPHKGSRKCSLPKATPFQDLYDGFRCPFWVASKKMFRPLAGAGSVAPGD